MSGLTAERLRQVLSYDPSTGLFTWLVTLSNRSPKGKVAGAPDKRHGYVCIRIDGALYFAHRLAFLYVNGEFPPEQVDHIDCNPSNNKFSNLRAASLQENCRNVSVSTANTSGFKGAHWDKQCGKWRASISNKNRTVNLGTFPDPVSAYAAYCKASDKYHGEFGRVA